MSLKKKKKNNQGNKFTEDHIPWYCQTNLSVLLGMIATFEQFIFGMAWSCQDLYC